ncbi:MAG TPA: hypothetical protein VFH39_00670 [Candidatus Saccharimonadales bacterium]|nr:hypothetical protein [Candidatus Saccharimonadales bacterium]
MSEPERQLPIHEALPAGQRSTLLQIRDWGEVILQSSLRGLDIQSNPPLERANWDDDRRAVRCELLCSRAPGNPGAIKNWYLLRLYTFTDAGPCLEYNLSPTGALVQAPHFQAPGIVDLLTMQHESAMLTMLKTSQLLPPEDRLPATSAANPWYMPIVGQLLMENTVLKDMCARVHSVQDEAKRELAFAAVMRYVKMKYQLEDARFMRILLDQYMRPDTAVE